MTQIHILDSASPEFPSPEQALDYPNGLLAAGGNLAPKTVVAAYRQGIFPWFSEGQPLLWWSPDPRGVLYPEKIHISRSLAKLMRKMPFRITTDRAFLQVVEACAAPRAGQAGSWITHEMQVAYLELHRRGIGHSIEIWMETRLVGGLYGLLIGGVFCGESMFSHRDNASKIALFYLARIAREIGIELIDCQLPNDHLTSLGVEEMARQSFLAELIRLRDKSVCWPVDILD